ncbi:hypothetical protein [Glutamicibacter arilaitensis]|uniref:hypothetical protein n=1 Tax=Glutamicibacter arilaitensis TaxID=256701 RepID=UPI003FCFC1D9
MQRYFIEAFDHEDPRSQIRVTLKNIRALRDAADDAGVPVVYTAQPPNQSPRIGLCSPIFGVRG